MEDGDQDGAGDGGQGLALAAFPGQAAVALAEEGVGPGGGGGDDPAAGDLIQPGHGRQHRGAGAVAGVRAGAAVGVNALRGGDLRDQLADPVRQRVDLPGQGVDLVQQDAGRLAFATSIAATRS